MNHQDKTIVCKDCGQEFIFTTNEQVFLKREASPTNRKGANRAATPERTAVAEASVRCSMRYAPTAEKTARFRSSPGTTVPFIAAIASAKDRLPGS